MSKFLGPIHYWLYTKIQVQEEILKGIYTLAETKGYNSAELKKQSEEKFGAAETSELSEVIDETNIHGWLQGRISSVESRLALTVTTLLNENVLNIDEIISVFENNALETAKAVEKKPENVSEVFSSIYNNLLSGMPCDRVNEVVDSSDNSVTWIKSVDIHSKYWDIVGGDVENFHKCIKHWIDAYVDGLNAGFIHTVIDGKDVIERV